MKVYPDYKNSVYNIPYTLLNMLGIKNNKVLKDFKDFLAEQIFFVLVDGFGYELFEKHVKKFLNCYYSKITSIFPSTTAAAITTIYTGLSPKQHGVLEWYMYYEEYDKIIKTLPFTTFDSDKNDYLIKKGVSPEPLFSLPSVFEKTPKDNIKINAFFRKEYAFTTYTTHIFKNGKIIPYTNTKDCFNLMKKSRANLNIAYIDTLDILQHHYGPFSNEVKQEIKKILSLIIDLKNSIPYSTIIISADHGQIEIKNKKIVKLEKNTVGGSPRDVFIYSEIPPIENITTINKKEILSLLGPGASHPKLQKRLPHYIILADDFEGVWFEDFNIKGLHGGLTPFEMYVPFIVL